MIFVGLLLSLAAFGAQQWSLDHYGLSLALPEWLWVRLAAGWVFLVTGVVARRRIPESGIGALMIVFSLLWIGTLTFVAPLIAWWQIGEALAIYGVLFVILLSFPRGRLQGWERWVGTGWLVFVAAVSLVIEMFHDPYVTIDAAACCPEHLLLIGDDPAIRDAIRRPATILGLIMFAFLVTVLVRRWRHASTVGRRSSTLGTFALPLMLLLVAIPLLGQAFASFFVTPRQELYVVNLALLILPAALFVSLLRTRLVHARVADMLRDLESGVTPEALEERLRGTLGTPDLRLVFKTEDLEGYVGVSGRPVDVSNLAGSLTILGNRTAILHDPELDSELVRSAGIAARLAIDNARLQAELRSQLLLVRESRRRLVDATDEARQRVERDLHDGAQQRLVALSATLRRATGGSDPGGEIEELLAAAADETDAAISELRALAQGIHPAILTQAGLGPAVSSLADRAPIPVTDEIAPGRYADDVESTAYFVIAEGLANAFKHSGADEVHVVARPHAEELVVTVEDNGSGTIDPEGTGLRGLEDRVGAVGGRLRIDADEGSGVRMTAWIPLREDGVPE